MDRRFAIFAIRDDCKKYGFAVRTIRGARGSIQSMRFKYGDQGRPETVDEQSCMRGNEHITKGVAFRKLP